MDLLPFVLIFFCFWHLTLHGNQLARGYSSGDPRNHCKYTRMHARTHTHTHIQLHTTPSLAITNNQVMLSTYTHPLCGQWQHFFRVIQGCRAGFEPRTSHSSCSASSLTAIEPPLLPSFVNVNRSIDADHSLLYVHTISL